MKPGFRFAEPALQDRLAMIQDFGERAG